MIDTIMIFAAGRGTRMGQLTENHPKTLLTICGKPILHYLLELTLTYPFKRIVINTFYLADQVNKSIADFKAVHPNIAEIVIIKQEELLENGGAVKNAAHLLGSKPIFTLNGDVIIKSQENIFNSMQAKWDPVRMDFLLLLQKFDQAIGYKGNGDFEINKDGRLERPKREGHYNYMHTGLNILKPTIISANPLKKFSQKDYYLDCNNKLYGITIPASRWYHANQPEDIVAIEASLCQK